MSKSSGKLPMKSLGEKCTRTTILHDLKRIAIAINELVRDLDRIERETK